MTAQEVTQDEIAFSTSGTSGTPVVWLRTAEQLRAEAELVARTLPAPVDRVISYAPTEHLYGRIFGQVLPHVLGVEVENLAGSPLEAPRLGPRERVLVVCLPSTWRLLRDVVGRLRDTPTVTVVHSTGRMTDDAHEVLQDLTGTALCGLEVLGSTEAGAVAYRPLATATGPDRWSLFDDVDMANVPGGGEQRLEVRSPRLARRSDASTPPSSVVLDDLVVPTGPRAFQLIGRATGLVKVNGRRVQLEHVERAVRQDLPGVDVACVPRQDAVRGEHYTVVYAPGREHVRPEHVWAAIARMSPRVAPPRDVRQVEVIPRGPAGKIRHDRLVALVDGQHPPRRDHRAPRGAES